MPDVARGGTRAADEDPALPLSAGASSSDSTYARTAHATSPTSTSTATNLQSQHNA